MFLAARVGLLSFALAACSGEELHPPQFGSDAGAVENSRSCKEAREGEPSGTVVFVDGQVANCVGDGVECSLADIAAFNGVCQVGKPAAICTQNRWQIACVDIDGGA